MALAGMLGDVTQVKVQGLLEERPIAILESSVTVDVARFEARVSGAAVQVVLLTGPDPAVGPIRSLAVEAIALQTGSELEYSEFPEQQVQGDDGRGYHLHQRYLELLADLRKLVQSSGGVTQTDGSVVGNNTGVGRPRGGFPPASCYPDPIRIRGMR